MANMLYNGVELPDIESVWDKETYACATIFLRPDPLYLVCFHHEPTYIQNDSAVFLVPYGANIIYRYNTVSGVWKTHTTGSFHVSEAKEELIWSSHDIVYQTTGEIYLAASDPVDPNAPTGPAIDLDFWRFAAMGMFVKTVVWGKKEATMYSYNGVVLPKLPVVEGCSNVVIFSFERGGNYAIFSNASIYQKVDDEGTYLFTKTDCKCSEYFYYIPDNKPEWHLEQDSTPVSANKTLFWTAVAVGSKWANHDVYDYDTGGLAFAKSEPIPVYE